MDCKKLASGILPLVGGDANINDVSHCMTRLRFRLANNGKADLDALKQLDGVVGVQVKSGQLQIIIGPEVSDVFAAFPDEIKSKQVEVKSEDDNTNIFSKAVSIFSGFFYPLVPAIGGAGIIKCLMAFFVQFGWMDAAGDVYSILNMIADGVFYFMPIFLAVTVAERLKVNKYLALTLAAMLVYPTIVAAAAATFGGPPTVMSLFGLPVPMLSYTSSVIPIILSVICLKYVYLLFSKIIPKSLELIITTGLSLIVAGAVTLVVLAPLGTYIGNYLSIFFEWLYGVAGPVASTLLSGLFPFMVITGMAYSFFPVVFFNFGTLGYDFSFVPIMIMCNINQGIGAFAVALKTRDASVRSLGLSTGVTAVMGITEPAMYGVNLRYKTPFYAIVAGNAVAGLISGIFKVKIFAMAGGGALAIPAFNSLDFPSNFLYAMIALAAGMIVTFVLAWVLTPRDKLVK